MAAQPDTYNVGDYNRSLIEASLDPLVTIGSDGKITDVNSATEKVTGLKRHQLIGTDFCSYFTEPEKAEAGYKQVFQDGLVKDYPLEIRHHDGHITPVLYNATVYKDETGNVTGIFAAARDITERKLFEARLQRLNQLYSALSQTNEAIIRAANEEDLFRQICKIAVENGGMLMAWVGLVDDQTKTVKPIIWYGAGSEEYLKGIPISTKADDPYGRGPTGTSIRENHPVWCQDFKHNQMTTPWHKRAEKFGWNSSASLPILKQGTPFGSLTIYSASLNAFDEEAQKLLTEMIKDINFAMDNFINKAKLEKNEKELNEAQRIARIGNWTWDIATDTIFWSVGYYKIIGLDPSQKPPGYKEHLKAYTPESQAKLDAAVKKEIQTGEPYELDLEFTHPKPGAARWIIARSETIRDKNNKVIGLRGTAQDITERKEAEEHIKELNEVRNKFIEIISHQLRTPLGAVNWNLEMLLNGEFGKLDPTQEQFLRVTHNASLRTTSRIHDLLTAMDVEEGRVVLENEEMALDSICAEITRSKMDECKLKEITCTYIPPEKDLPLIKGDPIKVRMAIAKLIENAISYTKVGGKIIAKLSEIDDHVRFEITDNGIGIPQTEQHRIFTRFFRASNAPVMLTDAFGLGLYLVKHFIEQHKGKIGFTSKEGEGSTFWFEIPVK